jgi:hypothetical protein
MPTISPSLASNAVLAVGALLALLLCLRWTRTHPEFDLSDLLTGDNGKVSSKKFGQTGAWFISSWGFVTMVQQSKMTEWYFIGYMTVWAGVKLASDLYATKQTTPPP